MPKHDNKNLAPAVWIATAGIFAVATGWLKQKAEDQQLADKLHAQKEDAKQKHQDAWEDEQRQRDRDLRVGLSQVRQDLQKQQRLFTPKKIAFAIITSLIGSVVWFLLAG